MGKKSHVQNALPSAVIRENSQSASETLNLKISCVPLRGIGVRTKNAEQNGPFIPPSAASQMN